MKNIVAVTACPTGIAHTYIAADLLRKSAQKLGIHIRVETQGAMGIENQLMPHDIAQADLVLIVSDIEVEQTARFKGKKISIITIESALTDTNNILKNCLLLC
jgi:PTS system fructose-specific IIB component